MEQFEKRIGGKEYTWLGVPIDKEISNAIAKQIWKEALEWVLTHAVYDPDDRGHTDYGIIDGIKFIEEELEGHNG